MKYIYFKFSNILVFLSKQKVLSTNIRFQCKDVKILSLIWTSCNFKVHSHLEAWSFALSKQCFPYWLWPTPKSSSCPRVPKSIFRNHWMSECKALQQCSLSPQRGLCWLPDLSLSLKPRAQCLTGRMCIIFPYLNLLKWAHPKEVLAPGWGGGTTVPLCM